MARVYHPIQQAYRAAKSAYEAACVVHSAELEQRGLYDHLDDETLDTAIAIEMDAEKVSHHDERMQAYRSAEQALFAWGQSEAHKAARAGKNKHEAKLVDEMFHKIHQFPRLKEKLVDICLGLEVAD